MYPKDGPFRYMTYSDQDKFNTVVDILKHDSIDTVAEKYDIDRSLLFKWYKQVMEEGPKLFHAGSKDEKAVSKKLKQVSQEKTILQSIFDHIYPEAWKKAKLARTAVRGNITGVNQVCRLLKISKETYYKSKSPNDKLIQKYQNLKPYIEEIRKNHPSYGYPRIKRKLEEDYNITVNHKVLLKLMKLWGLGRK